MKKNCFPFHVLDAFLFESLISYGWLRLIFGCFSKFTSCYFCCCGSSMFVLSHKRLPKYWNRMVHNNSQNPFSFLSMPACMALFYPKHQLEIGSHVFCQQTVAYWWTRRWKKGKISGGDITNPNNLPRNQAWLAHK